MEFYHFDEVTLRSFLEQVSSKKSVPGGGSVCALGGALAAALFLKVFRFSSSRFQEPARWMELESDLEKMKNDLLQLVNEDAQAYQQVTRVSKQVFPSPAEKEKALDQVLAQSARVPWEGMRLIQDVLQRVQEVESFVNIRLKSDYSAAQALAQSALQGLAENVDINLEGIQEGSLREDLKRKLRCYTQRK